MLRTWWKISWRYLGLGAAFGFATGGVVLYLGYENTFLGRLFPSVMILVGMGVGYIWTHRLIDQGKLDPPQE